MKWVIQTLLLLVHLHEVQSFFQPLKQHYPKFNSIRTNSIPSFGFKITTALPSKTDSNNDDNNNNNNNIDPSVKILGITGGIGSGKSLVCELLTSPDFQSFHDCEVHHIDSDKLAHSVYAPGSEAIQQIRLEFGDNVILKETDEGGDEIMVINRKNLGEIVFSDPQAMSVSFLFVSSVFCFEFGLQSMNQHRE